MPQVFNEGNPDQWTLDQCAWSFVDRATVSMLQAAGDADKGHLPAAGGMLDQTPAVVESLRLIAAERAAYQKPAHG